MPLKRILIIKYVVLFDKSKVDLFLKDLNSELYLLTYKDNIEDVYHSFTTTLSTSINKFSFEVSYKKNNRTTNPWYDKECKIVRKSIRDASNESLKLEKINVYKSLIKRKKRYYMNKRTENLSQLSKLDPKKLWRKILIHNTKENNMIPLRD
jgi:2-succinyl-5-enolpyruvyl-6-hydroxy-3-cyclohexene-1-carboxylate synthase